MDAKPTNLPDPYVPNKLTPMWAKFAFYYAQTGVGTEAARLAGYSHKRAHVTAAELLRKPKVQNAIRARDIKRDVHVQQTYRDLIELQERAMELVEETFKANPVGFVDEKVKVLAAARSVLETVAKAEGLMIDRVAIDQNVTLTLQALVQKIRSEEPRLTIETAAIGGSNGHGTTEAQSGVGDSQLPGEGDGSPREDQPPEV